MKTKPESYLPRTLRNTACGSAGVFNARRTAASGPKRDAFTNRRTVHHRARPAVRPRHRAGILPRVSPAAARRRREATRAKIAILSRVGSQRRPPASSSRYRRAWTATYGCRAPSFSEGAGPAARFPPSGDVIPARNAWSRSAFSVNAGCGVPVAHRHRKSAIRVAHLPRATRLTVRRSFWRLSAPWSRKTGAFRSPTASCSAPGRRTALFSVGETVRGVIRSHRAVACSSSLHANLSGLAAGAQTCGPAWRYPVYIKSILPRKRMKVKRPSSAFARQAISTTVLHHRRTH